MCNSSVLEITQIFKEAAQLETGMLCSQPKLLWVSFGRRIGPTSRPLSPPHISTESRSHGRPPGRCEIWAIRNDPWPGLTVLRFYYPMVTSQGVLVLQGTHRSLRDTLILQEVQGEEVMCPGLHWLCSLTAHTHAWSLLTRQSTPRACLQSGVQDGQG